MQKTSHSLDHSASLHLTLDDNITFVKEALGDSNDFIVKKLKYMHEWHIALLYMEGMVDVQVLHLSVLDSLLRDTGRDSFSPPALHTEERMDYLQNEVLIAGHTTPLKNFQEILGNLLSGSIILLLEGCREALGISAAGWEDRSVSEPTTQSVVRGPMEGFTENLRTNTTLIRRRIKDPQLWLKTFEIGKVTKTRVSVMYINHIANPSILKEVIRRLQEIEIDSILESGYIEELIQDTAYTPFPTIYNSERPDTIAAGLLEGKIAILVDGTPFVLLVPALFVQFFQSPDDYYQRSDISTLIRLIRFLAFFIAMLAPSFYIAITTFHQEMLPTNLLISLASQREGVPFPAFIEALLMELTYEILREAGVRIPRTVGQAVSIVGTLVIGQAAVDAGVVSAAMVIIVSITAISSYVIPENGLSIAVRMLRFVLMGLAASFGFYGVIIGVLAIVLHLTSLRSFGAAYMSPFGPFVPQDLKDTLFRMPWPYMLTRPLTNKTRNKVRQKKQKQVKR